MVKCLSYISFSLKAHDINDFIWWTNWCFWKRPPGTIHLIVSFWRECPSGAFLVKSLVFLMMGISRQIRKEGCALRYWLHSVFLICCSSLHCNIWESSCFCISFWMIEMENYNQRRCDMIWYGTINGMLW